MKFLAFGSLLLVAAFVPQSARADQIWGTCSPISGLLSPGTQGSFYVWEEWHDGFVEYIAHSYWHRVILAPGATFVARVQPTSGYSINTVWANLYDACPPGAQVGTPLPPTTFTPIPNPGTTVTNGSGAPKTYWMQVYPWAQGGYGYMNYDVDVQITTPPPGASYCPGAPNSTGAPGTLAVSGTNSVSANNLVFQGTQLPANGFALLANGTAPTSAPFGDGTLCIAGSLQRLYIVPVSGAGSCSVVLDIPNLPPSAAIAAGNVRYFQLYYRDAFGPLGTGFNLTNGMTVTFTP